jgi:hypothetical protein
MKSIKLFFLFLVISLSTSGQTAFDDSARVFMNEVNALRSNPKAFKDFLLSYTSSKPEYHPGVKVKGMITTDSIAFFALRDAIASLDTVKPVDFLTYSDDIYKSIGDHTGIDTVTGFVKHDGKTLTRIRKYNKYFTTAGENFIVVTNRSVISGKSFYRTMSMKEALALFVIDCNMYNKKGFRGSHRNSILNSDYKFTAVKLVKVKDQVYLFQEFAGY